MNVLIFTLIRRYEGNAVILLPVRKWPHSCFHSQYAEFIPLPRNYADRKDRIC